MVVHCHVKETKPLLPIFQVFSSDCILLSFKDLQVKFFIDSLALRNKFILNNNRNNQKISPTSFSFCFCPSKLLLIFTKMLMPFVHSCFFLFSLSLLISFLYAFFHILSISEGDFSSKTQN